MKRQSTEDFYGDEATLHDIIMVDACHFTFVQTHRMYNYGLRMIMMCPCRLIDSNKCTTLGAGC